MSAAEQPPSPRPSPYAVGVRVLLACLGWGSLTGLVTGVVVILLILVVPDQGSATDVLTTSGGEVVLVAGLYGALIGCLFSVVFGIGSGLGAVLAARSTRAPSSPGSVVSLGSSDGSSDRSPADDEPVTAQEVATVARWTRTGFVVTAAVLLVIVLVGSRVRVDGTGAWWLVLEVLLALAVGVWRSGRAAELAMRRAPLLRLPKTF